MPESFVLTLWSLLFISAGGVLSISLARITRLHPAYFFLLSGSALALLTPFTFPAHSMLAQLSEIGALFLIFLSALDIEWDARFSLSPAAVLFGIFSQLIVIAPVTYLLHLFSGGEYVVSFAAALIAAVYAPDKKKTAAGESFRSNHITGRLALTGLISEISAMTGLAVMLAWSQKISPGPEMLQLVVGTLLLLLVLVSLVPQALRFLLRRVGEESYALFYMIIALAVAVMLAVRRAGIEPMLGAYAAGFVITRFVTEGSRVMERLRFTGMSLIVPAFYLYFGLSGILVQQLTPVIIGQAILLTGVIALLRFVLGKITGAGSESGSFYWLRSLHKNPLVLVLLYFASARGLISVATAQILFWYCVIGEILAVLFSATFSRPDPTADSAPLPRVLLPLSNPETMLPLMNLATHLGDIDRAPRLFPLNIVTDDAGAEERIKSVEAQFNEIIRLYASREQTVELTARIENDRTRAVSHAARELLCDRVVLGLGAIPTLQRPQGYSFLENLSVAAPDRMLFAAHLSTDLAITNTINVIVPHQRLLHTRDTWLPVISTLAKRLRAQIAFFGESEVLAELKASLAETEPRREYSMRAGQIHAGLDLLTLDANPNAFTIAILERAALFPEEKIHARLPEMMLRAFADRNFMLLYPPLAAGAGIKKPRTAWKKIRRWLGF